MFVIVLLAVLVPSVLADTPANCSYEEISGKWSFHIGPKGGDKTIDCSSFSVQTELTVQLSYPDVAVDESGNKGFWTLIYNQGFEVVIANQKFFAFSNYSMITKNTAVSHCDSTKNGWSHDLSGHNWACYYGVKVPDNTLDATSKNSGKIVNFPSIDLERKFVKNLDFVEQINNSTKLWQATHYPELEGMSLGERLQRAGGVPKYGRFPFPSTTPASHKVLLKANQLPDRFDWRDVSGDSYVSPVRNQGGCGSCYAFSSMGMLEARYRLLTNNTKQPVFSPQDVVSCSEYAQGCEGGFPYLIAGKYGEDFGVVEETCYPYRAHDSTCREGDNCIRYHSTNYYYVGGYYGACSEEGMRAELVQNGPMSVSFEVYSDFQHYRGGIYRHTGLEDKFNPWEITNHAVLLVGYGEELGTKFWIVKNSWGETWGEKGYFRIMRGVDETSIESMAVAVTPVVPKN
jgi:cathepsin C